MRDERAWLDALNGAGYLDLKRLDRSPEAIAAAEKHRKRWGGAYMFDSINATLASQSASNGLVDIPLATWTKQCQDWAANQAAANDVTLSGYRAEIASLMARIAALQDEVALLRAAYEPPAKPVVEQPHPVLRAIAVRGDGVPR